MVTSDRELTIRFMTRATRGFCDTIHKDVVRSVSHDVNFLSNRFPDYKIGANNVIIELEEQTEVPSLKEMVAKETAQLLELQQRLSVRELAKRFEDGLFAATELSTEDKWRDALSLEKHVLLKKLRDLLESLRARVVGRNKDEVDKGISMVEALAVQLTQREGELFLEKEELKKLAILLKKASEDAKKVVEEERARARAEIEGARAAVQRIEHALNEQGQMSGSTKEQDLEELMKEVQEARRIKMLHHPSKVMDMEHELQALRIQLVEKSRYSIKLCKELAMNRRHGENKYHLYELEGLESLGSCLRIISRMDIATEIFSCSVQWYRIQADGSKKELISGATKSIYAPEPFDVGRFLQVDILCSDERETLTTTGPIDPAKYKKSYCGYSCEYLYRLRAKELQDKTEMHPYLSSAGLGSHVEALLRKSETVFNVVVLQMNGSDYLSNSIHVFHVGKLRLRLSKGKTAMAKEFYSPSMQLCGARGGGNAAGEALFWQAKKGLSFTLAFESARDRNAAIMLARRFAFHCNIVLAGPGDRSPAGN